jgi:alpha-1,6-mannosyltransferase
VIADNADNAGDEAARQMSNESFQGEPAIERSKNRHWLLSLIGLGVLLLVCEVGIIEAHINDRFYWILSCLLISGIPFVSAVWLIFRRKTFPPRTFLIIVVGGGLFRLILLPLDPPRLSTDIYRYIWDGRVQGSGLNPYLYLPVDPQLAGLRDNAIYPHINRKEYAHTIYPPVAQMFFLVATRVTQNVLGFKTIFIVIDLVTIGLIAATLRAVGQPAERVIVYAWHPLPIFEFGGSGHIDALMTCFIAVALWARVRGKFGLAGFALAGATLVKLIPIVLLPAFYKRWDRKLPIAFAATVALCYLPYLLGAGTRVLGFLPQYAQEEGLQNGARYYLLLLIDYILDWCGIVHEMPPAVFNGLALALLAAIAVWALFRQAPLGKENDETKGQWISSAFVLALVFSILLSSYYPWYYSWLAVFLCFVPNSAALTLTLIVWPLYRSLLEQSPDDLFRFQSRAFLPVFAVLLVSWIIRKRQEIKPRMNTNGRE